MKKVYQKHGFTVYEDKEGRIEGSYKFGVWRPDESPSTLDSADYVADNLQECKDFIEHDGED